MWSGLDEGEVAQDVYVGRATDCADLAVSCEFLFKNDSFYFSRVWNNLDGIDLIVLECNGAQSVGT